MRADPAPPFLVRLVILGLAGGGAFGVLTAFFLMRGAWPWTMPDLAYRFLAGAAAAYAVGGLIALLRGGLPESELLAVTVFIYGIPLVAAILIQPGPIDWRRPVAWGFVGIVTPAVLICAVFVARRLGHAAPTEYALIAPLRNALLGLAVAAGLVGLIVFVAPRGAGFVWPWAELAAWKPLDSRLVASMLLTIGGGALLVAVRDDHRMARVFLPMLWAYCVVAGLGLILHASSSPALRTADLVYVAIFAVILVGSAGLYLLQEHALLAPLPRGASE